MRRTAQFLIFAAIAVVVSGCPPDFTPFWKADKLRVMAVQADPVVAPQGEPVQLSAAVWAPGDPQIDYDWSWCPLPTSAEDEYECPLDDEQLDEFGGGDDNAPGDPFDLGDGAESTYVNPFSEQEVREFCEQLQRDIVEEADDEQLADLLPSIDCEEGWEVSVRLEVATDDNSVVASKRFRLAAGADEPNQNPRLDRIEARPADGEDLSVLIDRAGWEVDDGAARSDQWVEVGDDEPLPIVQAVPIELRALVDSDSVQTRPASEASESGPEALDYRWLTTTGSLVTSTGVYAPESNTLETASNTVLTMDTEGFDEECPNIDEQACPVRIWNVVRDGRLGVDWWAGRLRVLPEGGER